MVFHHFHKHSKKYVFFATLAIVFSLVTFSIPQAIRAFTGRSAGELGRTWVTFKTRSGVEHEISREDWILLSTRMRGFLDVDMTGTYQDLVMQRDHLPLIHAIQLAEADEMGIEVPPEVVDERYNLMLTVLQARLQGEPLTRGMLANFFSRSGFSEQKFKEFMAEALKTSMYRRSVRGPTIHDPEDIRRHYVAKNELVTVDYVAFPFAAAREALAASPPSDEELQAYYDEMSPALKVREFSHPMRLTLDIATLNPDTFDASAVPAEFLSDYLEPTDDQVLARYRSDPIRYGTSDTAVETIADVPAEAKERILRDHKAAEVLQRLRRDYETFVSELDQAAMVDDLLPVEDAADADAESGDGTPDGGPNAQDGGDGSGASAPQDGESGDSQEQDAEAAAAEAAARAAEREAKLHAEFLRLAESLGLTVTRVEKVARDDLKDLDPPGDPNLPFITNLLGMDGSVQVTEAARAMEVSYLLRLVERLQPEAREFDEVREDLLEAWLDEKAEDQARDQARAFRDAIRTQALAAVPDAEKSATLAAEAEARAAIEADDDLPPEVKKLRLDNVDAEYFIYYTAMVGTSEGPLFAQQAETDGLTVERLGPIRRSTRFTPHFRERFEGATRFLLEQEGSPFDRSPRFLGYAVDTVSNVLVDTQNSKAVYVGRMVAREAPPMEEMTPRDRLDAENANLREIQQEVLVPYMDMFSIDNILRMHEPQIGVEEDPDQDPEQGGA